MTPRFLLALQFNQGCDRSQPSKALTGQRTPKEEMISRPLKISLLLSEGFAVYEPEWWHYDYKDWKEYPIMNLKFSEIGK